MHFSFVGFETKEVKSISVKNCAVVEESKATKNVELLDIKANNFSFIFENLSSLKIEFSIVALKMFGGIQVHVNHSNLNKAKTTSRKAKAKCERNPGEGQIIYKTIHHHISIAC